MNEIFDHRDIQHRVWINWYHNSVLVERYFDNSLTRATKLPYQQFLVLSTMNALGEKANATEMAKLLDKNTNTLSTILDRMERKGLVKKTRDTQDKRLVFAIMTPKGQEKFSASTKASITIYEKLSCSFSKAEMTEFNALLVKLMKNTEKLLTPPKPIKKHKKYQD